MIPWKQHLDKPAVVIELKWDKDFLVLDVETPEILTMKEFLEQY